MLIYVIPAVGRTLLPPTGHSRQPDGMSAGRGAVRRSSVQVGRGHVHAGAVWREFEDADAARSVVGGRVGVAGALAAAEAHVAGALDAGGVTAATAAAAHTARCQLLPRPLTAARLLAFYDHPRPHRQTVTA